MFWADWTDEPMAGWLAVLKGSAVERLLTIVAATPGTPSLADLGHHLDCQKAGEGQGKKADRKKRDSQVWAMMMMMTGRHYHRMEDLSR